MNLNKSFGMTSLGQVARYGTDKIQTSTVTIFNYISTENMLPNKAGVTNATSLPPSDKVNKYSQGDILISNIRPYFKKIWLANKDGGCSSDVLNLKVNDGINNKYVYYCLLNDEFFDYIMVGAKGVKMPRGDKEQILKYKIPLPSLKEQNYIVSKIATFDEKISSNARLINYLEEYSQLLFHKWFTDYNFPDKDRKPYKDNGGEIVEIGGKTIPKEWNIIELNSIVNKNTESINPLSTPEIEYNYYSIPVFDETKTYSIEKGNAIGSNKYKVNGKNLLVSKLNPWFKRIIYPYGIDNAICSTEFVVWNPKIENILEYLYVVSNTPSFTEYCTIASIGTSNSHKRVNPDYMLKYVVPFYKPKILEFNEMIKPIVVKIHHLIFENKILEETRDLLIRKLIK